MKQITKIFDNYQAIIDEIVKEGDEYKPTADMLIAKRDELAAREDGEKYLNMKWVGVENAEGKLEFIPVTPDMISVPTEVAKKVNEYVKTADRRTRRALTRKFHKVKKK